MTDEVSRGGRGGRGCLHLRADDQGTSGRAGGADPRRRHRAVPDHGGRLSPPRPRPGAHAEGVVERTFRAESGRTLATLARALGDLGAAEDAVQEAFVMVVRTWPATGLPDAPGAWVTTTARNGPSTVSAASPAVPGRRGPPCASRRSRRPDCTRWPTTSCGSCSRAATRRWPRAAHVELDAAAGVRAPVPRSPGPSSSRGAVAQRPPAGHRPRSATPASRSACPPPELLDERVPPVLGCTYLMFTEGYTATAGDASSARSCATRRSAWPGSWSSSSPTGPEAEALLALLLVQDSRRAGRLGPPTATWCSWPTRTATRGTRTRIAEGTST